MQTIVVWLRAPEGEHCVCIEQWQVVGRSDWRRNDVAFVNLQSGSQSRIVAQRVAAALCRQFHNERQRRIIEGEG